MKVQWPSTLESLVDSVNDGTLTLQELLAISEQMMHCPTIR